MYQENNCWVCGRSSEDINSVLGEEDPKVKQFKNAINEIKKSSEEFINKSNKWIHEIPEVFKDMGYMLFIENPDQFKSKIPFLNELVETHYEYVQSLYDIWNDINQEYIPSTEIKEKAPDKFEAIVKKIENLPLGNISKNIGGRDIYFSELDNKKLQEGILYLQQINEIKHEYESAQKEAELNEFVSKKPNWATVNKYVVEDKRIPICMVCKLLIIGFAHS